MICWIIWLCFSSPGLSCALALLNLFYTWVQPSQPNRQSRCWKCTFFFFKPQMCWNFTFFYVVAACLSLVFIVRLSLGTKGDDLAYLPSQTVVSGLEMSKKQPFCSHKYGWKCPLLSKISCFVISKHGWKCHDVSLEITSVVASYTAGQVAMSHQKCPEFCTTNS